MESGEEEEGEKKNVTWGGNTKKEIRVAERKKMEEERRAISLDEPVLN